MLFCYGSPKKLTQHLKQNDMRDSETDKSWWSVVTWGRLYYLFTKHLILLSLGNSLVHVG